MAGSPRIIRTMFEGINIEIMTSKTVTMLIIRISLSILILTDYSLRFEATIYRDSLSFKYLAE
jgi:hypothetical protein